MAKAVPGHVGQTSLLEENARLRAALESSDREKAALLIEDGRLRGQHAPTAEAVAGGIWTDLTAWCGEESHHDDMTLLVLRVVAP